jgi:uncharacterized protein involved in exopolysaccharide biosynthesis
MDDQAMTTPVTVASQEWGLFDYARILWRHMTLIGLATIAGGATAFWLSSRAAPQYEAAATLMVTRPKVGEVETPPPLASFSVLIENRTIARDVVEAFGLDRPPYGLTPQAFVNAHLAVDEIRGTNFLRVRVTLGEPILAAKVANALVDRAIALYTRLNENGDVAAERVLKRELADAAARVQEVQTELVEYRRTALLEFAQQDAERLLSDRGRLAQIALDIESERARLAQAETELTKQPATLDAMRAPALERTLRMVARGQAADRTTPPAPDADPSRAASTSASDVDPDVRARGSGAEHWTGIEFGDASANPVHEILQYQIAASRTKLSSLARLRDELSRRSGPAAGGAARLRDLHQKKVELDRRQSEYDLATKLYADAAARYEQSRSRLAGRSAELTLVDPAVPPDGRSGPRPRLGAVEGSMIAFLLAVAGAVLFELVPARR